MRPVGHGKHAFVAEPPNLPLAHREVHEVLLCSTVLNWCSGQAEQCIAPGVALKVPAAHGVQSGPLPVRDADPAAHEVSLIHTSPSGASALPPLPMPPKIESGRDGSAHPMPEDRTDGITMSSGVLDTTVASPSTRSVLPSSQSHVLFAISYCHRSDMLPVRPPDATVPATAPIPANSTGAPPSGEPAIAPDFAPGQPRLP